MSFHLLYFFRLFHASFNTLSILSFKSKNIIFSILAKSFAESNFFFSSSSHKIHLIVSSSRYPTFSNPFIFHTSFLIRFTSSNPSSSSIKLHYADLNLHLIMLSNNIICLSNFLSSIFHVYPVHLDVLINYQ